MTQRKQKLELTWIGKENRPRLEPRILLEDSDCSYHASHRVSETDQFDNRLIFGDNLLALKALEQEFAGKVKCIYIDPPFNTGEAFEHYDDGVEHSVWLSLMRDRLYLLSSLLAEDGSLFVHIDDNELGYLIVLLDEIFGRRNRISVITFKQGSATGHKAINPGVVSTSNFVLLYAKNKSLWVPNKVYVARGGRDKRYGSFITNRTDHHFNWEYETLANVFAKNLQMTPKEVKKYLGKDYENEITEFVHQNAKSVFQFARPNYSAVSSAAREMIDASIEAPDSVFLLEREGYSNMYFKDGRRFLFYDQKLKEVDGELVTGDPLTSIWDDLLSNNLHNEGGVKFPKGKKPEGLIKRIIDLTTYPNDIVLDSFAGSGTTGAVAHKMGRRWIMVELGDHCHTHVIPRLQKVIDGKDSSGITKAVNWRGGGGFRYFRLAPSLLEKDKWGNWIINPQYNAAMLAEAVCKLEGFTYAPSETSYWQHGYSTEQDFIYVTTQTLTHEQLLALNEEVSGERSLLILCAAYRAADKATLSQTYPNLTVKKIPNAVMRRCEYGKDDYSLQVAELPLAPEPEPHLLEELEDLLEPDAEGQSQPTVQKGRFDLDNSKKGGSA